MRNRLIVYIIIVAVFLSINTTASNNGNLQLGDITHNINYDDCIWRPGESTKCKVSNSTEWRPIYMEEMTVCSILEKKKMEWSKWSWAFPEETDLYLFAELISGSSREDSDKILLKNGYKEISAAHPAMAKKEIFIRWMFANISKKYKFMAIKQHSELNNQWGKQPEELKGKVVWFTTYWRCIESCDKIAFGSMEICINLDTGRCSYFDDYWTIEGKGYCSAGTLNRWYVLQKRPWSGNPFSFPELEAYEALK